MTSLAPYLLFDGTCQKAMEFYRDCLGGELTVTFVKDSPAKESMSDFQQENSLHAHLKCDSLEVFASDWLARNATPAGGNTVCLFLRAGNAAELKAVFEKLSDGAEVTDPPREMFFGLYAALNDRFGVRWMFQSGQ